MFQRHHRTRCRLGAARRGQDGPRCSQAFGQCVAQFIRRDRRNVMRLNPLPRQSHRDVKGRTARIGIEQRRAVFLSGLDEINQVLAADGDNGFAMHLRCPLLPVSC